MKSLLKLFISISIPLIVGFIGSFFTSRSVKTWYLTIKKPFFNPPDWIFAPVWTLLFILMGIAFFIVWTKNFGNRACFILTIYSAQLLLNILWSFFFFKMKNPFLGLIDIIFLLILIFVNVIAFLKINTFAGVLLLPYFLWVSFATILNYSIFILNR